MPEPRRGRDLFDWHDLGWRQGLLLGAAVLVLVYAVAELTAWLPALRDGLEHLPVAIVVLVVGTVLLLVSLAPRGARR